MMCNELTAPASPKRRRPAPLEPERQRQWGKSIGITMEIEETE
jgi:hypothetical protein